MRNGKFVVPILERARRVYEAKKQAAAADGSSSANHHHHRRNSNRETADDNNNNISAAAADGGGERPLKDTFIKFKEFGSATYGKDHWSLAKARKQPYDDDDNDNDIDDHSDNEEEGGRGDKEYDRNVTDANAEDDEGEFGYDSLNNATSLERNQYKSRNRDYFPFAKFNLEGMDDCFLLPEMIYDNGRGDGKTAKKRNITDNESDNALSKSAAYHYPENNSIGGYNSVTELIMPEKYTGGIIS
jgi:hypothetical protein